MNKEVLVTGTPVFDEEKNIRLVVTNTRDFPELKRLEAQLLALEEKQEKAVQELAYLRSWQAGDKQTIYHSAAMREVMEIVRKVAPTDVTVLITGESGTGKELIANEIYQNSDRCGKPFIKLKSSSTKKMRFMFFHHLCSFCVSQYFDLHLTCTLVLCAVIALIIPCIIFHG